MNPSHIIGRLACILAAQSDAPPASIIAAPAAAATPRPLPPGWNKPVAAQPRVSCTLP